MIGTQMSTSHRVRKWSDKKPQDQPKKTGFSAFALAETPVLRHTLYGVADDRHRAESFGAPDRRSVGILQGLEEKVEV